MVSYLRTDRPNSLMELSSRYPCNMTPLNMMVPMITLASNPLNAIKKYVSVQLINPLVKLVEVPIY